MDIFRLEGLDLGRREMRELVKLWAYIRRRAQTLAAQIQAAAIEADS